MEWLSLGLSDALARQVRAAAKEDGIPVPEWLSAVVLEALRERARHEFEQDDFADEDTSEVRRTDGL